MTSGGAAVRALAHRWQPRILAVAVAGCVWASAAGHLGVRSGWPRPAIAVVAIASGAAAWVARTRRWPLFTLAAAGWLGLAAWPAAVVASYYAATRLPPRRLAGFLVGAALVMALQTVIAEDIGGDRRLTTATSMNFLALVAWLVGIPLVFGLWVRARRETLAGLRDRAERLEREQAARAAEARAAERTRIAREMHDVLAHRVSLMVLHAGALEVTATDPTVVDRAGVIREVGREALAELREVLGVLRRSATSGSPPTVAPQPAWADLDRLVAQTRTAGIVVRRIDEGRPRTLPVTVQRTVYRVVQEALTNVQKHAPHAAATITLRYAPEAVEVRVRNGPSPRTDGAGTAGLPGAGVGLLGLRERIDLLGGRLDARPRADGGFLVRAVIPAGERA